MKKTMVILAVMLMLCTCMLALAQENAFVGRWNEDSELGGSITLRSDGSFEGSVMLFYEMKGFYTLNDSTTATLHPESVTVMSGMEWLVSGSSTMGNALLEQLDGKQLVLSDDGTLSFFGMEMLRDESYREVDIIYDGRLEGQWELKNHAGELDQMMLYFTPDGVVYAAYNGKIYEKTYTFDGTTVVMGEEGNTISAVLQEDGSLKVEFAGTYVKTKAYAEQNFAAIAGLYGEEQNGYISGYYLTPEGNLLNMYGLPGVALQWATRESGMVMAGNRIGTHDDLGNRFYAMVEDGEMTEENWTISNSRWMRGDVISYPLLYTVEEFVALMGLDSVSNDLPNDIGGMYVVPGEEFVLVIFPDGTAMWDDMKMTVKADGNRVVIFSEEDSGYAYIMTYSPDTLTMFDGEQRTVLSRISAIDEAGADNGSYDRLFELTIDEGGVTVNGFAEGVDDVTELVIPATLRGLPVVAVSDDAFRGEEQLISVTIEEGVQHIGSNAFAKCVGLESAVLPKTMLSAGESVFSGCSALRSVELSTGLTEIPTSMFYNCRMLETVAIPEGVTIIGESAFVNCESLEDLVLPATVNKIEHFAFMGSGIRSLFIPEGVEYFHASMIYDAGKLESVYFPRSIKNIQDGYTEGDYSRSYYYSSSVTFYLLNSDYALSQKLYNKVFMESYDNRENDLFTYAVLEDNTLSITGWKGSEGDLYIPGEIDGMVVSSIGEKAFLDNKTIETVYIEEGVTTISRNAFFGCSMKAIHLPSTLKTLETSALENSYVKSLYLPEGLETIGNNALSIDGAYDIYIPASVQTIDRDAFGYFGIDAMLYVYDQSIGHMHANYNGLKAEIIAVGEITQAPDGAILRNGAPTVESSIEGMPTPIPTPTPSPTPEYFHSDMTDYELGDLVWGIWISEKEKNGYKTVFVLEDTSTGSRRLYEGENMTASRNVAFVGVHEGVISIHLRGNDVYKFVILSDQPDVMRYQDERKHESEGAFYRYSADEATAESTITPEPIPSPTPAPTSSSITLVPSTDTNDRADNIPQQFCGQYSMTDSCSWPNDVTVDFWVYPDGYVYYRATCEEDTMIRHGTAKFENEEVWGGTICTLKISYHHQEGDYFNTCTHYEYRINEYDGRITFSGTDTACMSSGEFTGSELLNVAFVTAAPTSAPTAAPDYIVFEIPAEARSKEVSEDDPAGQIRGAWHGTYYDTVYDFYFAPNGVVYGSSYDYEFEVWTHYCVGQYTVSDSAVEMTWPEGLRLPKILTFTDDPNSLLLYEEYYMNYYIRRAAE